MVQKMNKLNVVVMGQDCEKFIGMCLDSVKGADKIIYCDGGSVDLSEQVAEKFNARVIYNKYDQEDRTMNGKQRNFYLDYLKKNHLGEWVLVLDADEIVEDFSKLKEFVNQIQPDAEDILCSVKMRHLIGDLGHEDATVPIHFVPHRLFKVTEDLFYPEVEHPVLQREEGRSANIMPTTIWHLAYTPNMWDIKKRYDNHMKKSNMHTPEFLAGWYKAHLFGQYPISQVNPVELPKQLLDEFGIDRDELYFNGRNKMQVNHYQDAIDWKGFFNPKSVALFGCGFGQRVKALEAIDVPAFGFELSKYAVKNSLSLNVQEWDICEPLIMDSDGGHDLIVAYDLLEHLAYDKIEKAIENLVSYSKKYILVSVPVKGDPNLEADPTHIIKETKEWWVKQFTDKGLKQVEVPQHFLFGNQLMIFEK